MAREWWRRSGGALDPLSDEALRELLLAELGGVRSWKEFQSAALSLDAEALVPDAVRRRLDALPRAIHLFGDAVSLEYEVEGGEGVVRLRLREGQARRLRAGDLPSLDRPLRFEVLRGGEPPFRADSLDELQGLLRNPAGRVRAQRQRHQAPRRGGRRR